MAEPAVIVGAVKQQLGRLAGGPLAGRKVVVSAGGTREAIDAVRFLGNRSSGLMGRAVAEAALLRGAMVTLVSTTAVDGAPYRVEVVETAEQMAAAVRHEVADADVLVMAAAVADYRPAAPQAGKIERCDQDTLVLDLVRTVDVLASTAQPGLLRVAFAAEAGPRLDRARAKRLDKKVDLLVFNDILAAGVGIGSKDNEITIIGPDGEEHVPRASKEACAEAIVTAVERALQRRNLSGAQG
jgi:phosphopantothenoylcysteine decarboxylase/phosphopantothenate--cysteine ligase